MPNGENGPEFEQVQADQAMAFHFVSTGQFVANFKPLRWKGADHPVKITCTGDYNRRTILSLQIDGTIQRPVKPEDWTF